MPNENNSRHTLYHADSRNLSFIPDNSVHLVVTSPPYWNLKTYESGETQLGLIDDYQKFLDELDKVWAECYRVLVPGGRLICVVGDLTLARKKHGRHRAVMLHADISIRARNIGFDNLTPILWHKITNVSHESKNGAFLGTPYFPNTVIKNEIEYILMNRKPGGYRKVPEEQKQLSEIDHEDFLAWNVPIWNIRGESTRNGHPAPFPLELAERLVRMYSYYGDTVLDPFCGSGTTIIASNRAMRNSIGVETEAKYCALIKQRLESEHINTTTKEEIVC